MVELNIDVPEEFYNEESKNDYFISSEIKKVWAVQIDMLAQVKRICDKYGIRYFADSGTLIGAIRHKGYIPWDDDIDLAMLRKDYNKFLEVAKIELENPYFLQTVYSDDEYMRAHAQLRNSDTTGYMPYEKNKKYNRGIFIDIFPLDYIPNDKVELDKFIKGIKCKWRVLSSYINYKEKKHSFKSTVFHYLISVPYCNIVGYRNLFRKYEEYCSRYSEKECNRVSYIAYSRGKEKHYWDKKWFSKCLDAQFEFTDIKVPIGYDERLKKEYGDYMIIKNVPSTHGELILNADISFKQNRKER